MEVQNTARNHWKKVANMGLGLLGRGFNSSNCKTMAKMAMSRIKLLRNKREGVIKKMRRDIAMLLESDQDGTARIRVEHVIREQNIMVANELIELFCELVVARLPIIAKQRECPADLKEGISSLIFAAPRCSDIPELLSIRDVFQKKYGKDFVSAATDLRPNAGVNRLLIEKLSVKTPSGEVKLKVLKEIAKEYLVQWDTTESEVELLKPPEERIEGPVHFISATSMPLKPVTKQSPEPNNSTNSQEGNITNFQDPDSAASEKACAATEAASLLAYKGAKMSGSHKNDFNNVSYNSTEKSMSKSSINSQVSGERCDGRRKMTPNSIDLDEQSGTDSRKFYSCQRTQSNIKFDDESDCDEEIEMEEPPPSWKLERRHSYNAPSAQSDIRFDESDHDEEQSEVDNGPPEDPAQGLQAQSVHPKLPNYDILAARFEALKHQKSRT